MTNFMKYPKIKIIGDEDNKELFSNPEDEIVIEEKIDGANFRFYIKDNNIIFGSRNLILDKDAERSKSWGKCIEYIKDIFSHDNIKFYNDLIFFGECCIRHSTPYDFDKMPPFLGFDIFNLNTNEFLDLEDCKRTYSDLGIEFVPIIEITKVGKIKEFRDEDIPKSKYYDGQAEGIVLKNYQEQIFAKYVTDKHKERNIQTYGGSKKWAQTDTAKISAMFCTNPRIEKKIFELIHEGKKLEKPLMKWLPQRVWEDIREEHYKEILHKNYKIDVGKLRRLIAKRCLYVLENMIQDSAFNKE
jgi:ATP-dependent RNA circularization protein (DNA/RNA ligase family)